MILSPFDGARNAFENLNDRERRLVVILGAVLAAMIVVLPLWFVTQSISSIEEENADIRDVLRDITRARAQLAERDAARRAAERRYDTPAPPLGSFLEQKAREAGFERPLEVTDQPEKVAGGFTRRHVRASLPGVGLRTAVDMLTAVENSPYPVSVERLHIEHYQAGDRYNVNVGVFAFDRTRGSEEPEEGTGRGRTKRRAGRAGPPAP